MEARERYRRDLAASVELGKQQSAEVIQRLQEENEQKDESIRKIQEESKQKDERIRKVQEEKDAMQSELEERIRSLEAQLAQANKHD